MNSHPASLAPFLRPRSIAIVGFSSKPGSPSRACLEGLVSNRFDGPIHLVGRSGGEVDGRRVLTSVDELPADVDLALFLVPAAAVKDAVAGAIRRRVKAGVIFASGFAEMGEAARRTQDEIAAMAREGGLALLGPNCLGYTNYVQPLVVGFMPAPPIERLPPEVRGAVAVVTQSGGLMAHFHQALTARHVPVAYRISTGNEVGVEIADFIDAVSTDPQVGTIAVYAEHVRSPQRFLAAVRRARRAGQQVVMMHVGRGERARRAAASHTGALAGDYTVMAAQVTDSGALLVETIEELLDTTELLVRFPQPPTRGVAVLTTSGAFCAHANDCCEQLGLDIPSFSPEVMAALKARMPDFVELGNPFDLTTQVVWDAELIVDCAKLALSDPRIGSVCIVVPYGNPERALHTLNGLVEVSHGQPKPLLLSILGDETPLQPAYLERAREAGMLLSRSSERSLRALAAVTAHGRRLHEREADRPPPALPASVPLPPGPLAEWQGKRLFAEAGIPVVEGELARSAEAAVAAARRIGYPVVLKLQSRDVAHKTEIGAVLLGIADDTGVRAGWATLHHRAATACPQACIDGVLVERFAPKGLELMVGARRDPAWGPVVMLGLGGIWVEALQDVRVLPAAASQRRIAAELARLKTARLLQAFRGAPPRDVAAVARVAAAVGSLMQARPEIEEIDVNPLVVLAEGEGAWALDALVVVSGTAAAAADRT